MIHIDCCDLCGGTDLEIVIPAHTKEVFITGVGTISLTVGTKICRSCGFVFLSPRMDSEELNNYYDAHSRYIKSFDEISKSAYAELCKMQIDLIRKKGRISQGNALEIGSAEGFFLFLLSREGFHADGVEPGVAYKKYYAENYPELTMHFSMLENTPLPKNHYDLCVMRHVLEHIESPTRILQYIHNLMVDEGLLYIEVPNLSGAPAALSDYFHEQHLSYFNRETIRYACNISGFSCDSIEEWNDNPDGSGFNYPVLRILARKTSHALNIECPDHSISVSDLHEYFLQRKSFFSQRIEPLERKITNWVNAGKRLALFGGGPHTVELLQALKIPRHTFICAFDNDSLKWGKLIGGVKIVSPHEIDSYKPDIVIISSREFENEIASGLKPWIDSGIAVVKIYMR